MKGRPRKTDASKRLAGTYRPDRAKQSTKADGLSEIPDPPDHLSDAAKGEWERLAPLVAAQRTMTEADLRGFEILCETLASAADAQANIRRDGSVVKTSRGDLKAHPATKTLETARAQATRLLVEFGLTPRARGHVEPTGSAGSDNNPFAKL